MLRAAQVAGRPSGPDIVFLQLDALAAAGGPTAVAMLRVLCGTAALIALAGSELLARSAGLDDYLVRSRTKLRPHGGARCNGPHSIEITPFLPLVCASHGIALMP